MSQSTSSTISSIPSLLTARSRTLLSTLDRSATRLSAILSTAVGTDKFLLTIYYTLKFLAPQINRLRSLRARRMLASFITTISANLLPGETVIAVVEDSKDDFLVELETGMRNMAGVITDVRVFMRLWGLLGIYAMAKRTLYTPPKDGVTRAIVWGQIGSIAAYQALENVAYLAGKGVLRGPKFSPVNQKRWWVVGCRFWMAYVGLEAARLLRDWQLNFNEDVTALEKEGGSEDRVKKIKTDEAAWRRAWYANAAYSPMTVHYSLPDGCLSDEQVGLCGIIVGFIGFGHLWRQSAA